MDNDSCSSVAGKSVSALSLYTVRKCMKINQFAVIICKLQEEFVNRLIQLYENAQRDRFPIIHVCRVTVQVTKH